MRSSLEFALLTRCGRRCGRDSLSCGARAVPAGCFKGCDPPYESGKTEQGMAILYRRRERNEGRQRGNLRKKGIWNIVKQEREATNVVVLRVGNWILWFCG